MDRITDTETENENAELDRENETREAGGGGLLRGLRTVFSEARTAVSGERSLLADLMPAVVGFLFAGCHLIFGTYPLALAFVASLSHGVWAALAGSVVGSIFFGKGGVVSALVTVIVAFIRVIISGGDREGRFFGESILLRMCASVIGGFISAAYGILLSGISESTVFFGVSMILLPPALTFVFSGLHSVRGGIRGLLFGKENILDLKGKDEGERARIVYFEISALVFLFFLTLSLGKLELLGVSASFVFVSAVTLLVAKRFGALRALAVGFASSLGVSGVYAVSFGLLGLVSGCLFGLGAAYGLLGGGAAAVSWSVYSAGLTGLLSTLPEYAIAAVLASPLLTKLFPQSTVAENGQSVRSARDMIGTMALVYQKKYSENLNSLELALGAVHQVLKKREDRSLTLNAEECRRVVVGVAEDFCRLCPSGEYCRGEGICPAAKNASAISAKIMSGVPLGGADINLADEFCQYPEEVAAAVGRAVAKAEKDKFERNSASVFGGCGIISSLISEARRRDDAERGVNGYLSDRLGEVLKERGLECGVGRVFGESRFHFIIAGEDKDGERITSESLHRGIEEGLGVRLGVAEYFRREDMVLMECDALPSYRVEYAASFSPLSSEEASGDSLRVIENGGGRFYAVISDGMGSGGVAAKASGLVCDYLEAMLPLGGSADSTLHLLNMILRQRAEECSVTVDAFGFDLYTGEATFIKSGAALSYVIRDGSIFRLRSKTAPIGLLSTVDSERIRVEVRSGDYVVMMSDGVCQSDEESAWLLELLSRPIRSGVRGLADLIIAEARGGVSARDDMSVLVMRISDAAQ